MTLDEGQSSMRKRAKRWQMWGVLEQDRRHDLLVFFVQHCSSGPSARELERER